MISNVVIVVNGKKALPLRAIPYVTAWAESPDSLVRVLAQPARLNHKGCEYTNPRALIAYGMQPDGQVSAVAPEQWQHIANELDCRTKKLKADERPMAEGENHSTWREQAVLALPKNGFVLLDDFQAWYSKTRPLKLPSDDEVARWEAEQAKVQDPEELASVLADGIPLVGQSDILQLEVVLPLDLIDKLWMRVDIFADELRQAPESKPPIGRPLSVDPKVQALELIIGAYVEAKLVGDDPRKLPGTVKDLLKACQYIEEQCNPRKRLFKVALKTFRGYLAQSEYSMRKGRKANGDSLIWLGHAAEIVAKIPANTFSGN